jgi:hypothetical protein
MENIKNVLGAVEKDMRAKVIATRLHALSNYELDENTISALEYYTYMFSNGDTCDLETTNPVIYGVAMKQFIVDTYNIWQLYKVQDTRSFDEAINEGLSSNFHDFRDHFVEFTHENIDDILIESDKNVKDILKEYGV